MILRWSNSGPAGERNAFGSIVTKEGHPIICQHVGSMWLCHSCAKAIIEHDPDNVVRVNEATAALLRNGGSLR